jgi:hypothetical protein
MGCNASEQQSVPLPSHRHDVGNSTVLQINAPRLLGHAGYSSRPGNQGA